MGEAELARRVQELERRLAAIESRLGIPAETVEPPRPVVEALAVEPVTLPPAPLRAVAHLPQVGLTGAAHGLASHDQPPASLPPEPNRVDAASEADSRQRIIDALRARKSEAPPPVVEYAAPPPVRPPAEPAPQSSALEQAIGLKLAGWAGAIVLVIGAALGIKYAYDEGWLEFLTVEVRLGLMAVAGLGLIGAGEYVRLRINPLSAVGLFGAGVATLFLVSYAGHGYYQVYDRNVAFLMMAAVTLIGAGVSMRGRLVSIGLLALVGGHIAPIVLSSGESPLVPLLSYLLMLQVVGLVLAAWGREEKWWLVRGLVLAATALWVTAVLMEMQGERIGWSLVPLPFVLAFALLFQLEAGWTELRRARGHAWGDVPPETAGVYAALVTAGATAALLFLLREQAEGVRGAAVVALAAACALAGLLIGRFADRAGEATGLATSYRGQSYALLVLAAPVALGGPALVLGWALLATVFAVMGHRSAWMLPRVAALLSWGLAILYVLIHGPLGAVEEPKLIGTVLTLSSHAIPAYLLFGLLLMATGHGIARLLEPATEQHQSPAQGGVFTTPGIVIGLSVAATVFWIIVVGAALPALGATLVLLGYLWLLQLGVRYLPRLGMMWQSVALLGLVMVKWAAADLLAARLATDTWAFEDAVMFSPAMGVGLLIAASIPAMYWLRRGEFERFPGESAPQRRATWINLVSVVILVVTFGLTMEIERLVLRAGDSFAWPAGQVRHMGWTVLWGLALAVFIGVVRKLEPDPAQRERWRVATAGLATLLALKFVLVDTVLAALTGGAREGVPALGLNLQTAAAGVTAGVAGLLWLLALPRPAEGAAAGGAAFRYRTALLASGVVLWAGTLELARVIDALTPLRLAWPPLHLMLLAWSAWWMAGVAGLAGLMKWLLPAAYMRARLPGLAVLGTLVAAKLLLVDLVGWRLVGGSTDALVMLNYQAAVAAIVLGGLFTLWYLLERGAMRGVCGFMIMLALLVAATLEIDRAFEHSAAAAALFADPHLARQVGFSIFWSLFAVASVTVGFRVRMAALRYFGLGLFGVTLLKVVAVDLSQVETGYRILSFVGLGLLLLGTSVLYGKLSPRLLKAI